MTNSTFEFMREVEDAFRVASGLQNRSMYKIYYGCVRKAPILTLGINPGGSPAETTVDGIAQSGGLKSSASGSYFENDEHDVLDCEWKENTGLRKLLMPLVGHDKARFRAEIVKTNLAFRRSARKTDINIEAAIAESAPFLQKIIERVQPNLVVLTGVALANFTSRFAAAEHPLVAVEREARINQVVFAASRVQIRNLVHEPVVVQVSHASQFSWTYERFNVAQRVLQLLEAEQTAARDRVKKRGA